MKFDPSRRAFLTGAGAVAAVAATETFASSHALAAIHEAFKEPNPMPNPSNLEVWHEWFLKQEKMFVEAIEHPEVRAILDQPLDENFKAMELDAVMEELLAKWPVAWNDHIRAFTDKDPVDKPLQKWVRSGLDSEYPSLKIAIETKEGKFEGCGSLINVDGEMMILTAEHVMEGGLYQYWAADKHDDIALMRASDYYQGANKRPPLSHVLPHSLVEPSTLNGKRIVVPGHDNGLTLRNRINKKCYISTGLVETPAVALWRMCHIAETSLLKRVWDNLIEGAHITAEERQKLFAWARDVYDAVVAKVPNCAAGGLLFRLPPGEAKKDDRNTHEAMGMSGSPGKYNESVIGAFSSASEAYLATMSYSIGTCRIPIKTAIENYRVWKRSQGAKTKS